MLRTVKLSVTTTQNRLPVTTASDGGRGSNGFDDNGDRPRVGAVCFLAARVLLVFRSLRIRLGSRVRGYRFFAKKLNKTYKFIFSITESIDNSCFEQFHSERKISALIILFFYHSSNSDMVFERIRRRIVLVTLERLLWLSSHPVD